MAKNDLIVRLSLATQDFNRSLTQAKKEVSTFQKGIASIGSKIAPLAAFTGVSLALGDAVRTSMEFEKSLSSMKALTGANAEELAYFKEEAIRLGSTTTQTASQVVDAFKLIGSQMPELLQNKEALTQVTESAIVLAEAAEIDVPEAAKALTGSLNQMGQSSLHASEYINILAAASQQGSADIPYLNRAIEKAGGTASSVGVKFNTLVAAIEAIAPKITDASSAGTNLRNIFLTLESSADAQLRPSVVGLSQAVENLAAKHLNATEMTKMFGKESVTAALALVSEKDKFIELEQSITDTNTAFEQQRANNENLAGSVKGIQSAWEGLMLTVNQSNGYLKDTIDLFTEAINKAREWFMTEEQLNKQKYDKGSSIDVQESNRRIRKDVDAGSSMGDAIAAEKARLNYIYPEAMSYEARLEAYEKAKVELEKGWTAERKKNFNEAERLYNLSKNEWEIRNRIYESLKAQEAELGNLQKKQEGVNTSAAGTTANTTGSRTQPTDLELAAWNAEGWANEEVKGLHNKLRQAIESGEKIKLTNFEVDLDEAVEEIEPLELPDFKDKTKGVKDYSDALNVVAGSFGMLGNAAQSFGNESLSFVTNSFATIAQAIIQMQSLATASGVAQAAKMPFPYNLAAMATVVSAVASIFASLPKFAEGGIVSGSSFFGDRMVARVNSGEMILNQSQQGKLFRMINNGGGGTGNVQVGGEARVNGKTMYLAIKNYMRTSRTTW